VHRIKGRLAPTLHPDHAIGGSKLIVITNRPPGGRPSSFDLAELARGSTVLGGRRRQARLASPVSVANSQWARNRVPEPQSVDINPARSYAIGVPSAVPAMPRVAEPDVAIIRPAYDVMLVSRSIFVLGMGTLIYVRCAVPPP